MSPPILLASLAAVAGFCLGFRRERVEAPASPARPEGRPPVSALTPAAGFRLLADGDDLEIALAMAREIERGGAGRFAEVWEAVGRLVPERRGRLQQVLVEMWAREDPRAALAAAGGQDDLRRIVYRIWAEGDPMAVWRPCNPWPRRACGAGRRARSSRPSGGATGRRVCVS